MLHLVSELRGFLEINKIRLLSPRAEVVEQILRQSLRREQRSPKIEEQNAFILGDIMEVFLNILLMHLDAFVPIQLVVMRD